MMQNPWFTLIFYVLPVGTVLICKYWLMKDIWETDETSRLRDFIVYYMAISVIFWGAVLTLRNLARW